MGKSRDEEEGVTSCEASSALVLETYDVCVWVCRNQKYVVENKEYMRIKFYVKGSRRKANVQLDLMKVSISPHLPNV